MISMKTWALAGVALAMLGGCSGKDADNGTAAGADEASTQSDLSTGRVRGTVQAISGDMLTVQTYDGKTVTVPMDAATGYAWVVGSSLASLKDGDFVGTATTGPETALRAVELVIFPESMRGTGEGHYAWDVPGIVAANSGTSAASSAMTNGTVDTQSAMTNGTVDAQSAMTNGSVDAQSAMTDGTVTGGAPSPEEKMLTISYKGGTAKVAVPAGTPIVRFDPTARSVLAKGQKVFVVTPPGASTVKFVAIGKDGLIPPM